MKFVRFLTFTVMSHQIRTISTDEDSRSANQPRPFEHMRVLSEPEEL